jgi:hypothetical protein
MLLLKYVLDWNSTYIKNAWHLEARGISDRRAGIMYSV